jgi:plastocyanin
MSRPGLGRVVHYGVIAVGGVFLAVLAISTFGETSKVSSTSPPKQAVSSVALHLTAQDFQFVPTTLSIVPGASVTLAVTNTGAVAHSFTADSPSVSVDVPTGTSRTVTFTAPRSGVMAFYCRFHRARMQGTITAERSASPAPSSVALRVATEDFQFAPTALSAAPGASVTLAVTNTGAVAHSFTADSPSVSVDVPAGESRSVTFTAPASGGMAFYCRFHPRMEGTITLATTSPGG